MSTYRSAKRDMQIADQVNKPQGVCTFCNTVTEVDDLNTYGARCYTCYRNYCEGDRHYPSLTRDQRRDMGALVKTALAGGLRASPRDHIAYLEAKEEAGTASPAQRGFLAAVRNSAKVSRDD
jgi:hypothetical protein